MKYVSQYSALDRDFTFTCSGNREKVEYVRKDIDGVPHLVEVGKHSINKEIMSNRPPDINTVINRAKLGDMSLLNANSSNLYLDVSEIGNLGDVWLRGQFMQENLHKLADKQKPSAGSAQTVDVNMNKEGENNAT